MALERLGALGAPVDSMIYRAPYPVAALLGCCRVRLLESAMPGTDTGRLAWLARTGCACGARPVGTVGRFGGPSVIAASGCALTTKCIALWSVGCLGHHGCPSATNIWERDAPSDWPSPVAGPECLSDSHKGSSCDSPGCTEGGDVSGVTVSIILIFGY